MKKIITHLFFGIAVMVLPGCAKKLTKPLRLRPLTAYLDHQSTHSDVTLRIKQLKLKDCEPFLGKAAHRLFKKRHRHQPIYPIQLSITNTSHQAIALRPEDITIKLADTRRVIRRLQTSSITQVVGSIAAGLLVTGLLAAGSVFALSASGVVLLIAGSTQALAPLIFLGGSAFIVAPLFLVVATPIASTVKGIEASRHNRMVQHEVRTNVLKNAILIDAHQTIDTLIFVEKKDYKRSFTIAFSHPHEPQQKVTFHVHLPDHDL